MKNIILAFAFFCIFCTPHEIFAQRGNRGQTIEVRLASPVPRNSEWGRTLDRIAAEWARVTNNEVRLRILHDGVEGSESKMFSSLSADNIQAALFTSFGLLQICPAAMTLSVPFRIKDDAEMELVFKEVLPILDAQISKTKFAVVTWSRGGWVNIFSKDPILTLDDLRRQKIATQPEAEEMNTVFKTMGFHMVETEITDIVPRMANNIVTACYQTPAAIAPMGLHKTLKNMLSKPLAPFLGAIVINRVTWNKISPERQRDIMRVTQSIAAEFDALMPKMVDNAVTVMSRDGLRVNDLSPEQEALWNTELQKAIPLLLGTTYDRDLYNKIGGILEKARSRQ